MTTTVKACEHTKLNSRTDTRMRNRRTRNHVDTENQQDTKMRNETGRSRTYEIFKGKNDNIARLYSMPMHFSFIFSFSLWLSNKNYKKEYDLKK